MNTNSVQKKIIIVGGGAAGFFTAANLEGSKYDICILEKGKTVLQKVKIAGGGRCNVTHACFDPKELVRFYPRGFKELRSVFTKFQPGDTMEWFEQRGVPLKIEADNRIFPISDSSQSIINALQTAVSENGVRVYTQQGVQKVERVDNQWRLTTKRDKFIADIVIFCTGSSPRAYEILQSLNLNLVSLVPSLFTFNIQHQLLDDFMGTVFTQAIVKIPHINLEENGPLLITHWGLSGPAILKLSAWGARKLKQCNYLFDIEVNFLGVEESNARRSFEKYKSVHPKKTIQQAKIFDVTNRFWTHLIRLHQIDPQLQLANMPKSAILALVETLCKTTLKVNGKSTFKDEFVTAGGVNLREINFRTMAAKSLSNFYLAGEVIDVDAITGGFNFQACWSEAFLIAQALNQG